MIALATPITDWNGARLMAEESKYKVTVGLPLLLSIVGMLISVIVWVATNSYQAGSKVNSVEELSRATQSIAIDVRNIESSVNELKTKQEVNETVQKRMNDDVQDLKAQVEYLQQKIDLKKSK